MAQRRIWHAEDIAHAMERLDEIREGGKRLAGSSETVANEFGLDEPTFRAMINNAKKNGFDAYPVRSEK